MEEYEPKKIEKKWQKYWEKKELNKAEDFSKEPKLFLLVEFPYPSGDGLHVGHCRSYTAFDVIARKKRMQGYNVLYPMGWDAFGLPTENYAIKTGIHPKKATKENTDTFREQEKAMAFSFDWQREVNTTEPEYYKWTQWIFLKLFEHGLAYKAKMPINWCTCCKIGLANEEVIEGKCERCGGVIERREREQWMLKITKYAERLISDLGLVDYPKRVVALQKDWIGKSEGYEADFKVGKANVRVFTTRIDTIFGCTYLVLSPEHPVLKELKFSNEREVEEYVKKAKSKLERERLAEQKEKTGIRLEGITALNPANGKEAPVFTADYVLMDYGTGAIMAVPAHDKRDLDFAEKHNLEVIKVIESKSPEQEGILINSGEFNGLSSKEAKGKIAQKIGARKRVYYKLRDWVFSRQRYWGEPIPMIFCEKCGWVADTALPIELPDVNNYKPTEKGESPLAQITDWVNVKCPKCKGKAKRETDVMPNWAGSNWYFLRYCDPKNKKEFASEEKLKYWMCVDWYNGGMEHTTLHLLYSRFIYKFLWDIGEVPKELGPEPYKKRTSHGLILAEGGVKMSKSKGNVINPTEVIEQYGADTLRVYEMFMGPFTQAIAWDTKGIKGARRFIEKVWNLDVVKGVSFKKALHKTIKKVSEDIENMKLNTAISALMEFINECQGKICKEDFSDFLKIFAVFCPHTAEELWESLGNKQSIFKEEWPCYDKDLIQEEKVAIVVQVNGKLRDRIEVGKGISEKEVKEKALASENVKKHLKEEVKKVVFVKDKLINFVV